MHPLSKCVYAQLEKENPGCILICKPVGVVTTYAKINAADFFTGVHEQGARDTI